jgi:uncharacterized protein
MTTSPKLNNADALTKNYQEGTLEQQVANPAEELFVFAEEKPLGSLSLRRDLAQYSASAKKPLIRFVADPDNRVVPDLEETLPGRGFWVAAERSSLERVIKTGQFSRSAKKAVTVDMGMIDLVHGLLRARLLSLLGLSRRNGSLVNGFDRVKGSLEGQKALYLVQASDAAADGRDRLIRLARARVPSPQRIGLFTSVELDLALGLENVIHAAILKSGRFDSFSRAVLRLSGFEAIDPLGLADG